MRKVFLILILGLLNFQTNVFSSDKIINQLKSGGNIIFIRHAIAPGNGDPDNFDLKDCSTQRNLSKNGIEQSKKIGEFFKDNKIKVEKVLSSEWCRCKDTAKFAFKNFEVFSSLNSFYDAKFADKKEEQIKNLKKYIKEWKGEDNLVLITHYVVILAVLDKCTSSGEILISNNNFKTLGSIIIK
jgi:phosphohistidine phosphatase SixA